MKTVRTHKRRKSASANAAKARRATTTARKVPKYSAQLKDLAALRHELKTKNDKLCATEEELAVFRSKYVELYELAPVGYCIIDTEGLVLDANRRTMMLLGVVRSSLLHKPFLHLVASQYRRAYQTFLAEVAATHVSRSCDIEIVRPDRSRFFARLEGVPQLDENKNVQRIFTAFFDTSEQKRTLDTLARVTARFEAMFTSMSSAVVLTDLDRLIVMINPAAEQLFGYSPEELMGRSVAQLYAGVEDFAVVDRSNGASRTLLRTAVDLRCRRKDGLVFDAECIVSPVRDGRGRLLATIGIHRDITERKRAEEAVRQSEALFRAFFHTSAVGTAQIDPQGRFLLVNEQFGCITGYSREELLSMTVQDLTHPDDRSRDDGIRTRFFADVLPSYDVEKRYIRKDGATAWVHVSAAHVRDADGKSLYVTGIVQDITERKRDEEALKEQMRLVNLANEAIIIRDYATDTITYWNEGAAQKYGWLQHDVLGKSTHALLNTRFPETVEKIREGLLKYGTWKGELFHTCRDGRIICVLSRWTLQREGGIPKSYIEINTDITARKLAEEALRESRQRYSLLFSKSAVAASLLKWSENVFVDVNEAFETLFGYPRNEVIGRTPRDLGIITPEEERDTLQAIEQQGGQHGAEIHARTKAGDERVIVINDNKFEFEKETYVLSTMHDITGRKQIEEALRQSEEQFRILTEKSPDFIALHDKELRHLYVNPAIGKQNGLPQEAFIGKTILEMGMPIDFANKADRLLRETLVTGQEQLDELTLPSAEGPRHLQWRSVPLFEREGSVKAVMTVSNDITDRKRAEEVLMRSNEVLEEHVWRRTAQLNDSFARLMSVFESMRDGFFAVDNGWNLTYVNSEATRIWGIASQDLIGRSFWDITPGARGTIFEDQFQKVFAEHVPVTFEARLPGSERWVEVRAYPSRENLAVYFHDITVRREAEEERRRLASAVEAAAEAIMITDRHGNIQYVNPAFEQITGYTRAEARGKTVHLLTSGTHDAAFYEGIIESLQRSGVWRGRMTSRKKDGTLYFEDCIISAVKDTSGETMNFISIRRDETEKLRLESLAMAVNSMENIGYVFAGVRHEIGNPINNAKMALSVLEYQLERASKETVAQYVQRALGEIGRVERLLISLKSYNLYENLHPETLETARLLDELQSLLSRDLKTRKIELTCRVETGAAFLVADFRALVQVMLNLVTNSIDALEGRENGRIELAAAAEGSYVHLRISDNGCGITSEGQQRLFRPFFTTKPKGTGLGLTIVKNMLLRMNGQIEIRSTAGVGTEADITLQRGPDYGETAPQDDAHHR